jgi:nucleoside-diphosphate-sugar epimerase
MPLSHYGRSKLQAEAAVHAYADRVPAVVCRFPAVYGPRDRVVLMLFRMVARGFALTIGPWEREVSVIHAADAVAGLIAAGTAEGVIGRTYSLAHPRSVTWGQFVGAIGLALRRRPLKLAMPPAAIRPVALAAEAAAWCLRRTAVLNRDRVRELAQARWVCDPSTAMREIGFAPRFALAEGVEATASWLRSERWI